MKIYLADVWNNGHMYKHWGGGSESIFSRKHTVKNGKMASWRNYYILESYYYCKKNRWIPNLIKQINKECFMLDSGAFTFMSDAKITVNWEKYVDEYAEFINKYNITQFIEMDIDVVVGIDKVEQLRKRLEKLTGKQCIPVWHKSRGKQYFIDMCKKYKYVAIGGIVTKEITKKDFKYFPWFIETAHKHKAKIHALGFTSLKDLEKYNFDSVDSTAWLYGNRGGFLYQFDGVSMIKINKPEGTRLKSSKCAMYNFNEWVKFQKYKAVQIK